MGSAPDGASNGGNVRLPPTSSVSYFRCPLMSFVISNIETCFLPPKTTLSFASALIIRLFFWS